MNLSSELFRYHVREPLEYSIGLKTIHMGNENLELDLEAAIVILYAGKKFEKFRARIIYFYFIVLNVFFLPFEKAIPVYIIEKVEFLFWIQ